MDHPIENALWLLKRQDELELELRTPGRIRLTEEQELLAVRSRLVRYPEAVKAIAAAAASLHRPVAALSAADVMKVA